MKKKTAKLIAEAKEIINVMDAIIATDTEKKVKEHAAWLESALEKSPVRKRIDEARRSNFLSIANSNFSTDETVGVKVGRR